MFNTFNVPKMCMVIQTAILAHVSELASGIVMKSGVGVSHNVPTYGGYALTQPMMDIFSKSGCSLRDPTEQDIVGNVKEKPYYLEEISAMVFTNVKEVASAYLGSKVNWLAAANPSSLVGGGGACADPSTLDAVFTVPVYFNASLCQATKEAGTVSGLNVLWTINEPTAVAIAYRLGRKGYGERSVLTYDMGRSTFNVTIVAIGDRIFEVKETVGDTRLGGLDLGERIVGSCAQDFKRKNHGADMMGNGCAPSRIADAVRTLEACVVLVHAGDN